MESIQSFKALKNTAINQWLAVLTAIILQELSYIVSSSSIGNGLPFFIQWYTENYFASMITVAESECKSIAKVYFCCPKAMFNRT